MHIDPIDDRIRDLCYRLMTAEGEELEQLSAELQLALHEHADYVRWMARKTAKRFFRNEPSGSNAAD
jgi:hypothetical protein